MNNPLNGYLNVIREVQVNQGLTPTNTTIGIGMVKDAVLILCAAAIVKIAVNKIKE